MRKLFLTLTAAVALTFAANAQTEKGKLFLGGSVGYNYNKVNGTEQSTQGFNITPSIGYFISDNFAIGTSVGYGYSKASDGDLDRKYNTINVAPFARAYKGNETFKFFGQLSAPMSWGNVKENGTKTQTVAHYGAQLSPGIAFFPHKNVGLELSVRGLYYGNDRIKDENSGAKSIQNSFGLASDFFAPQLGVQFYF
ncbi:outer membrane beta-barrel protein [Olivibacter domesticus]|uniref:Outer membrane protein beta-barrel domain-containing protein n=1 Tax=Olivibacter domesticus TaxID=407022 RepID=A0A1H7PJT5_OLID1|nr:outer membrane beta-barrel protein [Olivibacter domesticus]SEL36042.1 Outer membrane protein beta-barrel domain-containing protein [Olivibacter domesticus]